MKFKATAPGVRVDLPGERAVCAQRGEGEVVVALVGRGGKRAIRLKNDTAEALFEALGGVLGKIKSTE